jgi:cytochrome c oxidase subunit 1
MIAVTVLSAVVYGHHMFVTGMNPLLGKSFMLLTLIISVPAELLFLNWLHTIWKGSIRLYSPMLFTLGVIFVFGLGGLTGIYLGTISTDLYLHDTMFVVGHFHFTMASASFLAVFAALYFWFPKMFGKIMDERLGRWHFWVTIIGITGLFMGQLLAGYAGQQRRLYDYREYVFLKHLWPLNQWTSYFAFLLGAGQVFFIINFFRTLFAPARRPRDAGVASDSMVNPWEIGTLEWTVPSPPPYHNFDVVPTVHHGPHEYANPEVKKALGKDWLGQAEVMSSSAGSAGKPGA